MVNQVTSISFSIENNSHSKEETADYEKALKLCGYGSFHYKFVFVCGIMFLSAGLQNGVNAYILPAAGCDLQLSSEEKGFLNVAFLVGGVVSSLVWGIASDVYGRKNILLGTLMADSFVCLMASLSQSFTMLLCFRTISGFTIGAPGALVFAYLGEFHSEKQRSKSICYVGFFWTISWLILPGLAWIIIPLTFSLKVYGYIFNSWRLFLLLTGIPSFIISFIGMNYPESPKFLLAKNKPEEALRVLRKIYAGNTGRDESDYPVKYLINDDGLILNTKGKESEEEEFNLTKFLKNIWKQIRALCSPPLLKYIFLSCLIFFLNMFGYYGLGLWLPELFNRFESHYKHHPNISVTVCELINNANKSDVLNLSKRDLSCTGMNEQVFVNTLIINAICLLGNITSGFLADRVGRRTIPVTTMLVAGIASLAIYFVRTSLQNLIVSCIFSLAIATANFALSGAVVDIFPTHVGAMAICLSVCFGRIGAIVSNLIFGMLLDISCDIPIFLVASMVLLGGFLGFLIPQSKS
ncbi:synaptic vesicle glycoprotein 2B-like [Leptopilina boulardi]|uniref:synaptic vesicle glycoprotein 2B-like n=1 Tax=Leptopilina boulardi TaxID=63433 RepID=UPI0021F5650E|nr:synaptic vesicle glycoprotein 2B-like [Leptopilina boulardi]